MGMVIPNFEKSPEKEKVPCSLKRQLQSCEKPKLNNREIQQFTAMLMGFTGALNIPPFHK
jgi:hypothetical protein